MNKGGAHCLNSSQMQSELLIKAGSDLALRAVGLNPPVSERRLVMACKSKTRQVRSGKKPGPKTVPVRRHKRSKPGKCR